AVRSGKDCASVLRLSPPPPFALLPCHHTVDVPPQRAGYARFAAGRFQVSRGLFGYLWSTPATGDHDDRHEGGRPAGTATTASLSLYRPPAGLDRCMSY